jgi:ubiquinone/menaquinone biosynthesis C-methylase UbiE
MPTAENTARFWDGIAEGYAKKPFPDPDATRRKLEITRARIRPGDVVLDLGCGTGTIALELAPHAQRVTGIDVSGEMLKLARRKASDANVANVEFVQAGLVEGLARFEPASIDGVCAYNVLHLTPDWRDALRSIHERLKPGGFFVSSTPCLAESIVPYRPVLAAMRWLGKAPPVEIFSADALLAAMREAGFTDVTRPDVGGSRMAVFAVATRPSAQ